MQLQNSLPCVIGQYGDSSQFEQREEFFGWSQQGLPTVCSLYAIGFNLQVHFRHVRSEDNPADGPARRFGTDAWGRRMAGKLGAKLSAQICPEEGYSQRCLKSSLQVRDISQMQ